MPTAPDDLKPGIYVAVTGSRNAETVCDSPFSVFSRPTVQHFGGEPLQVMAVSLPFVCVSDGSKRYALDVRDVDFQRVSSQYVKAMKPAGRSTDYKPSSKRKRTPKPDPRACPRCGTRMIEKMYERNVGTWIMECPQCSLGKAVVVGVVR